MLANILAVGLMASVMSFSPRYVVDNQNDTLTLSAEELNNNTYSNLAYQLNQVDPMPTEIENATITYNNKTFAYNEDDGDGISYGSEGNYIYFKYTEGENSKKWLYTEQNWDFIPFTQSMTINNAEWFIDNIEEPPSLTLSKYDLNNKKYTYLAEQVNSLEPNLSNTTISYNGETYTHDETVLNDIITYVSEDYGIKFIMDDTNNDYGKWILYDRSDYETMSFTASMTINNAQWFLDNINAPLDSGDMMTAITSGLPLMANLAQAFLNGFTSIFWNSTTNTLTTFSNFALIMLSVAIVFACIKLVLNVVRSNTGV